MLHCLSFTRWNYRCKNLSQEFHSIGKKDFLFDANKYLKELANSGRIDEARKVFDAMPKRDEFSWNTMISGYANLGRFVEARTLFDETPKMSAITWASFISGYCKMGCEIESIELFWQMLCEGHKPSKFVLGNVLRMCSIKRLLSRGEQTQGYAIKTQFDRDVFIVTGLIDMYVKCCRVLEAEYLFKKMASGKNHVTWTAMINGYSLNSDADKAIQCFRGMRSEGVEANQYTFPAVLTACGSVSDLMFGVQVHSCVVHGGFGDNVFVQSALVNMYAKCGDLRSARKALESREVVDVISWNAMIVGCVRQGSSEDALSLFRTMHAKRMEFDEFTYPSILNALASKKDVINGKSVHSLIFKTGFENYKLVSNALVDMCAKQNDLDSASKVFNFLEEKDVVSWTSLVTGCAHNGRHEEALKFFCEMRTDGINPDQIVTASILSSCAELALLDFGLQVHANFIKSELGTSLSVDNSLITMYGNCGCLEHVNKIFASMQIRNVITWTALIVGYAQNGKGMESLRFYDEMIACGTKPDYITFIGLLFSCSHAGLVELGRYYFESMVKDYGIRPGPDHYACMIDLLGRSGKMHEAQSLLEEMDIKPDATVWKALLAACRVHRNVNLAKRAATALFELEPRDAVPYVMLSNIYSATGNWEEAAAVRRLMKSRGISKEPGRSWMEVNSKVHTFVSEDRNHPNADEIYLKLDDIVKLIKEAGYVPDMNFALHDINEEGKEHGLAYHSEKLAVAFGLLYVPQGAPIRIYKNLRVCGDCHTSMKFISDIFQCHIILRDSNCFHHFKEGMCSCGDYW
ncbi:pentatricopeptide repeat-containing protein At2g03880, mitochondrial isoform X1 [Olea europaea var. sylvestris]|uniref:pentatricopeptide repeat-containing protein At2g03880, mitochondrial isoform X1 n=1 Tax=Olea europaea var. sylvestris TaxID=158386 RepID=UPI000C1D51A3|nr:pentatricopeptide repeat-containing protein At2g03880, mitochondrial isoform X1 [Olea europaea var. sylvestris]XP_022870767.1 pentatricopeptide repeat-containing protein At2g03880, mitochondrial isoform X1 [Olea europaea var. sylvestris]